MRKLIIVEGLPCSGKSTASRHIADKLGMKYCDEGSGSHPADYEFHAFLSNAELSGLRADEIAAVSSCSEKRNDGIVIPLDIFSGTLFDKLLTHKIYDFLPWDTEKPLMLDKWREFVEKAALSADGYVFNCVFLQNPMCETMMRFGFKKSISQQFINEIYSVIRPLSPFIVYLKTDDIRSEIARALPERGDDWINGVIDYHCSGEYGRQNALSGFDGYISALKERQDRELEILRNIGIDHIIIENFKTNSEKAYNDIFSVL